MALVDDPTDPKIDRWLRKQPPLDDLCLRYATRDRFRHPGEIGEAVGAQLGLTKPATRRC